MHVLQGDKMRVYYIKSPPVWLYGANLIFKSTKYVSPPPEYFCHPVMQHLDFPRHHLALNLNLFIL